MAARERLGIKHNNLLAFQIEFWHTTAYGGRVEVSWPSHYRGGGGTRPPRNLLCRARVDANGSLAKTGLLVMEDLL